MLLQLNEISKSYGGTPMLSGVSMKIETSERIGLIGVNGAGKSTLLQIIAGELPYDRGDVYLAKGAKIGYLRQNSGLELDNTIGKEMRGVFTDMLQVEKELRELEGQMSDPAWMADAKKYEETMRRYAAKADWFLQNGGYEIEAKIRGILHGMGFGSFSQDTPIHTLSGGQKTRLALAKTLLSEPDLLILDEPTNHLDFETLTWLEGYLRSYPGAILVVSHDRYFLDSLVTVIYELERNEARRYTGNYSKYVIEKEKNREIHAKKYAMQQEQIAKMEEYVERHIVRATSAKSAKNKRKQLDRLERIDKPLGDLKRTKLSFDIGKTSHKEVLQVRDLEICFGESNDRKPLLKNISFQLRRGEKVALIGPNGIGKSTLLKTIIGEFLPDSGEVVWGKEVTTGYYDQEQSSLQLHATILDEVWSHFPQIEEARIRRVLGNFLFSGEDVIKKIASLSGGEKARVALSKLMLAEANVMVLDEPTNHLDLSSKEVLESTLTKYEGTLLFISHDRYFLNKLADKIVELHSDGAIVYEGNYESYVESKKRK
ncbi:multidrug ABC transporter ATP-binding protein [Brevibacillus choshinensis]|uniref:Multidrug ABC transporter ATP-binding protein n=1 Tax=Brevibacillus choshinensis TaxID=54911 RepID=A0ABR5N7H8_BRECH|nr:ABC-F family ATP-binding cassette domain-containing protein [Brevibacillus choshinensis]KQL46397.1 multidrug ABC transporter ATP-binding protein [Brevibacillus choshinensis]